MHKRKKFVKRKRDDIGCALVQFANSLLVACRSVVVDYTIRDVREREINRIFGHAGHKLYAIPVIQVKLTDVAFTFVYFVHFLYRFIQLDSNKITLL